MYEVLIINVFNVKIIVLPAAEEAEDLVKNIEVKAVERGSDRMLKILEQGTTTLNYLHGF